MIKITVKNKDKYLKKLNQLAIDRGWYSNIGYPTIGFNIWDNTDDILLTIKVFDGFKKYHDLLKEMEFDSGMSLKESFIYLDKFLLEIIAKEIPELRNNDVLIGHNIKNVFDKNIIINQKYTSIPVHNNLFKGDMYLTKIK